MVSIFKIDTIVYITAVRDIATTSRSVAHM